MDRDLAGYLLVCAGVGALFGANGFPMFTDFFYPPLWVLGLFMVGLGVLLPSRSRA